MRARYLFSITGSLGRAFIRLLVFWLFSFLICFCLLSLIVLSVFGSLFLGRSLQFGRFALLKLSLFPCFAGFVFSFFLNCHFQISGRPVIVDTYNFLFNCFLLQFFFVFFWRVFLFGFFGFYFSFAEAFIMHISAGFTLDRGTLWQLAVWIVHKVCLDVGTRHN